MEGKTKKPMESVVVDLCWYDAISKLHQFERLEMYEAIFSYAKEGAELETSDPMKRMALRMIYDRIDEQRKFPGDMEA